MKNRVGVFLCDCAGNIGDTVDLDALGNVLEKNGEIAFVGRHNLLCSQEGKQFFIDRMKQNGGTHAVVAACSPKDHEVDFRNVLEEAGINKYLLQMANIREHCAWVAGSDKQGAGRKARAMITAAVRRVTLHEPLEEREIDGLLNVAVIGGGLAGIEAALLAAQAGREVTLIESSPSIGGKAAEYEEVAPTLECASCMIAPRLSAVDDHPLVEIDTNAEVIDILGYLGNFEIKVSKKARMVDPDRCIGCDECINACPVENNNELDHGLGKRKAIYVPFPGSVPNSAVVDRADCLRFQGGECRACVEACPMEAINFDQADEVQNVRAGTIILATGSELFDPSGVERLGYGRYPEVYTLVQFERLAASNGPTAGRIQKKDGEPPRSIAFIHCVGRDEVGYCSGICCQAAFKTSLRIGRDSPETSVYHLHTDLVSTGHPAASLQEKAVETNAKLIRISRAETIEVTSEGAGCRVSFCDGSGTEQVLDVDMIVLATAMIPGKSSERFSRMLDLVRDSRGFLAPDHPVLRTSQSSLDGVFIAGCVAGPKTIAESIAQGQAAAGGVISRFQPGKKIMLEVVAAHTHNEICSGCMICLAECPYKALTLNPETRQVEVNAILCHGCGTCVATCPSGAASARHFTDEQISAEIEEVLRA